MSINFSSTCNLNTPIYKMVFEDSLVQLMKDIRSEGWEDVGDEQALHLAPENTILQTLTATCNLPTAFLIKCNQFRRPEKHLKSQLVAVAVSRSRYQSRSLLVAVAIGHRHKSQSQSQPEPTIAPLSNASYHRDSQTISQAIHCLFLLSRFWPWFLWPKRPLFLH